jgi:hypothetical protein
MNESLAGRGTLNSGPPPAEPSVKARPAFFPLPVKAKYTLDPYI